ncbi:MAG: hypothetical protein HY219_02370 [Candidatus Staskawiczbacteria bacterium]|nr:hypothetical protein [Candidatus Staskawiczbacteria bacterium]
MILSAHLLLGAAIASKIKYVPMAIILALLSHYFLDLIPHIEYSIKNIKEKQWRKSAPDIARVFLDFLFGMLLVLIFSNNQPLIYVCAIVALIPDSLTVISSIFPNKALSMHDEIHTEKIHFLKYKKISVFWRIFSQVLAIIISVILLKY